MVTIKQVYKKINSIPSMVKSDILATLYAHKNNTPDQFYYALDDKDIIMVFGEERVVAKTVGYEAITFLYVMKELSNV